MRYVCLFALLQYGFGQWQRLKRDTPHFASRTLLFMFELSLQHAHFATAYNNYNSAAIIFARAYYADNALPKFVLKLRYVQAELRMLRLTGGQTRK